MDRESVGFRKELEKQGYSQEERYFYRLNRELIEGRRRTLNQNRSQNRMGAENHFWSKCPQCGSKMFEKEILGIKADQCSGCDGVFMNQQELQTLTKTRGPETFLKKLSKLFRTPEDVPDLF